MDMKKFKQSGEGENGNWTFEILLSTKLKSTADEVKTKEGFNFRARIPYRIFFCVFSLEG